MAVQRTFAEEVKHREAERRHTFNLSHGQLYALRELRILFEATTEEEIKGNVNILSGHRFSSSFSSCRPGFTPFHLPNLCIIKKSACPTLPLQRAVSDVKRTEDFYLFAA